MSQVQLSSVTLKLDPQQFNTIMAALGEAPFKVAAPVIQEVEKQVREQADAATAVTVEEKAA